MDLSKHKFFDEYDGVDGGDGVIVVVAVAVFGKHKFDFCHNFYHQLIDYSDAVVAGVVGVAAVVVGSTAAVDSGNFDLSL